MPKKNAQREVEELRAAAPLRIIGGSMRGRHIAYSGDARTRPMKDRVREALFNLMGPGIKGKHAIDLFAGTGALGLEALSRGALSATFVEQHFPTAAIIRQNAKELGVDDRCHILPANVLLWAKRLPPLPDLPWAVFCSPPYEFYQTRTDEVLGLVSAILDHAAPGSVIAVEADENFDMALLPSPLEWDVRTYAPAVVATLEKRAE